MAIRRFSTDGLSEYLVASHGFTIGLRRLKPTFLERTGDFLLDSINIKSSNRTRGPLESIISEKIPLANGISFKYPSTDELLTYIVASHGFIIGLRRLAPIFLERTGELLSEHIDRIASTRITGPLDAMRVEKMPLANMISFKRPRGGAKITSGLPGASRANGWA